jgi:pimeloyl-ACP methyl ester carboxylesterase
MQMLTLDRDGVRLAYAEAGSGEPPFVFVHGWCCDHTYFAPQVERFSASHRVVAVDLRGHGASDAPEQRYSIEQFVDDLAWLVYTLGLDKPIVVGHSMGGVVAVGLGAGHPELVSGVVAVDSALVVNPERRAMLTGFAETLRGADYVQAARAFVLRMFEPTDDATLRERIVESMTSARQHVMASTMEELAGFDIESAVKALSVPTLVINRDRPPGGPQSVLVRVKELNPSLNVGQTVGAGHFMQLEVPDQVNSMIEQFLKVSVLRPAVAA